MAKDSRSVRRKRRVRQNVSTYRKMFKGLQQAYLRSHSSLLMVLAQNGPVTVTQGTMQNVLQDLQTLNWQSVPNGDTKDIVFSLAEQPPLDDPTIVKVPSVTIRRIPDEDAVDDSVVDAAIEAVGTVQTEQRTGDEGV